VRGVRLLIELLRERVGSPLNYDNLAKDIAVSPPTVKAWVELLERLYVLFLVYLYRRFKQEHQEGIEGIFLWLRLRL